MQPRLEPSPVPRRDSVLGAAPWRVLGPEEMVESRSDGWGTQPRLPQGTTVCLLTDRPLARWWLRHRARRAGVRVVRELIVLPSTHHPLVVLDDDEQAVRAFWQQVATVPPGPAAVFLPATLALWCGRRLPWRLTGAIAPGRVLVGQVPEGRPPR